MDDSPEEGRNYTAQAGGGEHDLGREEGPLLHYVTTGTGFPLGSLKAEPETRLGTS